MPMFRVSNYNASQQEKSYTIDPLNKWTTALRPPFLLMVHGYNNDIGDANQKFLPVANQFDDYTRIGFYWENSREYVVARHRAKKGATSLKTFLVKNFTPAEARQLTIVSHSMGCRVVLDCLTKLANDANAPILKPKNVILWSAAVDDDEIVKGEAFYKGTQLPRRTWVMYSRRDEVLKKLYPIADQSFALGWKGPDAIAQ